MKNQLCSYIHCRSRDMGEYIPVIVFSAKGIPSSVLPPGQAVIRDLRLCRTCALKAKVHDLCTNKRWAQICANIAAEGAAPPDRDKIGLGFFKADDDSFSAQN